MIHDQLPSHLPLIQDYEEDIDAHSEGVNSVTSTTGPFCTDSDSYGVHCEYTHGKLTITSNQHYSISDVLDSPYFSLNPSTSPTSSMRLTIQKVQQTIKSLKPFFSPFQNPIVHCLMDWFYNSSITKSLHDLNRIVARQLDWFQHCKGEQGDGYLPQV